MVMILRNGEIIFRIALKIGNKTEDGLLDVMHSERSDVNVFSGIIKGLRDCQELRQPDGERMILIYES